MVKSAPGASGHCLFRLEMFLPLIGGTAFKMLEPNLWLAAAVAVATSIAAMHGTKTRHPPGGAAALIYIMSSPRIQNLGYFYAIMPVGAGILIMLAVALLENNLAPQRRYPEFW